MNKLDVTNFIKTAKTAVSKHSPEILTGLGIAGMLTTTVLAVKATPKALMLLEDAQYEKGEDLTAVEKVKVAWKPYVPAAITATLSTACLIGASSVNVRRNAALATAYQIAQTTLTEYKDKVIEEIGEKKEKVIREKIVQDKIDKNPSTKTEIFITDGGDTKFCDPISMRYFKTSINNLEKAVNNLNYKMVTGNQEYVSLSEFYDEIGLPHTANSDLIGWSLYRDGQIEIETIPAKDDEGKPCLMLEYFVAPRYDFDKLM